MIWVADSETCFFFSLFGAMIGILLTLIPSGLFLSNYPLVEVPFGLEIIVEIVSFIGLLVLVASGVLFLVAMIGVLLGR